MKTEIEVEEEEKSTITPGPWKVVKSPAPWVGHRVHGPYDPEKLGETIIAQTGLANAKLISASRELLESCIEMRNALHEFQENDRNHLTVEIVADLMLKADASIIKATA